MWQILEDYQDMEGFVVQKWSEVDSIEVRVAAVGGLLSGTSLHLPRVVAFAHRLQATMRSVNDDMLKAVEEAAAFGKVFQEAQPSTVAMLERLADFFPNDASSRVRAAPNLAHRNSSFPTVLTRGASGTHLQVVLADLKSAGLQGFNVQITLGVLEGHMQQLCALAADHSQNTTVSLRHDPSR